MECPAAHILVIGVIVQVMVRCRIFQKLVQKLKSLIVQMTLENSLSRPSYRIHGLQPNSVIFTFNYERKKERGVEKEKGMLLIAWEEGRGGGI